MSEPAPSSQFEPRTLTLSGGRSVVVRALGPDDVPGLTQLYEGLSPDDRYRRFFSSGVPADAWIERMANPGARGGFGLVAVEGTDPASTGPAVAEASYTPLANGDGELAITVASGWRGWLGPYLLDVLLEVAGDHGHPNLEADILTANQPMLALARARGYVTVDHADWSVVRILLGAAGREPQWPGPHDRPRLLVEAPGGRWVHEQAVRDAGFQVAVCPGPTSRRRPCPPLVGGVCPMAAGADAIVVCRPSAQGPWGDLPAAHAACHDGVPVAVALRPGVDAPSEAEVLPSDDSEVVPFLRALIDPGRD
jgi:hypothetical protein